MYPSSNASSRLRNGKVEVEAKVEWEEVPVLGLKVRNFKVLSVRTVRTVRTFA